jgi:DNA-3-methyladenine glycosylase
MFGPPGIAYVYLVYGMYDCLNVVTEPAGVAAAVLIRAVEPHEGAALMRASRLEHVLARRRAGLDRGREAARLERTADERLAAGPGLVAAAFGLDRSLTGRDLCDPESDVRIEPDPDDAGAQQRVSASGRIGVGYAGEPWASLPWRLALVESPAVSRR